MKPECEQLEVRDLPSVSVAVVIAGHYPDIARDVNIAARRWGDPPARVAVEYGNSVRPAPARPEWVREAASCLQIIHHRNPYARLVLVEAANDGFDKMLGAIRFSLRRHDVTDAPFGKWETSELRAKDAYLRGEATRSTLVAAAGNDASPAYPATSPSAIAVGDPALLGSARGPSSLFPQRRVPDATAPSGPYPAYARGEWFAAQGTSQASAHFAATVAWADELRHRAGLPSYGSRSYPLKGR